MKNNLADLNNHLFEMLEKLCDEDEMNDKEKFDASIKKAKALCDVSERILDVGRLQLDAMRVAADCGFSNNEFPALLSVKDAKSAGSTVQKVRL